MKYLTISQCAMLKKCNRSYIHQLIKKGKLSFEWQGKQKIVSEEDFYKLFPILKDNIK